MEIKQLEYYVMLCDKESFTEASFQCDITQSGLSKQIKKLEQDLGYLLIDRHTRSFRLTKEGLIFYEYAQRILDLQRECILKMSQSNEIRIGSMAVLAPYHFAKILAKFRLAYPQIQVYMEEDKADQIVMKQASFDFVILRSFMVNQPQRYVFMPLFDDSLCAVVSQHHPLSKRESILLSDLKEEAFVFPTKGSGGHEAFYKACLDAGFHPNVQYSFPQANTILSFVKENMGVTINFNKVVDEYSLEGLKKIPLKDEVHFPIAFIYPKDKELNSSQKILIDFIKKEKH